MKWYVGTRIAAGFGLAIMIFVIVVVVCSRETARLAVAAESIDSRRTQGIEAALQLNKPGDAKSLRDQIRNDIGQMKNEVDVLFEQRNDAEHASEHARKAIVAGSIVAVVLAILAGFLVQSIGQIITTLEDISTRSNPLAANGVIEAGEHNEVFGGVAQQVRSLARPTRNRSRPPRATSAVASS